MITAKEAKAISDKYTPDAIISRKLSSIEHRIKEAAANGYTTIYYHICYCGDILDRILKSLDVEGYTFYNYMNDEYCISWEQPNENQTTPTGEAS